jgi:hypothetical protein
MIKNSTSKFKRNIDQQRVLAALINYLQQTPSRTERLLICKAIKGLVTPKDKQRQARSRDEIEQCGKKRRGTFKQKTKKNMELKNIYYYLPPMLESVSGDVVKISTPIFTWLVMAGTITMETAILVWILVVIVRACIVGLSAHLALKK